MSAPREVHVVVPAAMEDASLSVKLSLGEVGPAVEEGAQGPCGGPLSQHGPAGGPQGHLHLVQALSRVRKGAAHLHIQEMFLSKQG